MENATKALIMAATILISMVVLSLGLYLAATFSSFSAQVNEETRQKQISEFNGQFLKYLGRRDLTIHDIITVANLAQQNNDNYDLEFADRNTGTSEDANTLYISVEVHGLRSNVVYNFELESDNFANDTNSMNSQVNTITNPNTGFPETKAKQYECTQVLISEPTQRVYKVVFEESDQEYTDIKQQ